LLGLAHRPQVPSYRRRVDKIIRQQLDPATITRRGSGHWHQADWLRVLDLRLANDHLVSAIKPYEGFGDVDHTIKELMSL
jgi:hypothetical protein